MADALLRFTDHTENATMSVNITTYCSGWWTVALQETNSGSSSLT